MGASLSPEAISRLEVLGRQAYSNLAKLTMTIAKPLLFLTGFAKIWHQHHLRVAVSCWQTR
ncbi:hypothetical protein GCM10009109_05480 [Marinobacterium sediminicola]